MDKSVKIPRPVAELIANCDDEQTCERVLWIMYKAIAFGRLQDMTNETQSVKTMVGLANAMLRSWERRQAQNRDAWEAFKQRRQNAEDAWQALASIGKQEERETKEKRTLPPTPPIIEKSKEESKEGEKKYKKESGLSDAVEVKDSPSADLAKFKTDCDNGFNKFWAAYPRKAGKQAAYTAFVSLFRSTAKGKRRELFVNLMKGLSSQRTSYDWNKENGKFIPHPTTWLHQRRWEDQLEVNLDAAESPATTEADELARKYLMKGTK